VTERKPILDRPLLSLKRRPHFKTRKSRERINIIHGFQGGQKSRTTVLARATRNLLDWTGKPIL
jgi:aspartokinase